MKKIAVVLLICMFSMFCFVACGTDSSVLENESGIALENGKNGTDKGKTADKEKNDALGAHNADDVLDIVYKDYGYINFGFYPQTIADKDAIEQMSETTDSTGYYISSFDDEHYAKVAVSDVYAMYEDEYEFTDEKIIKERTTYYFKVEPIKWRVFGLLDLENGFKTIYLISDSILDSTAFLDETQYALNTSDGNYYGVKNGVVANNWAYSELREYLNDEFYKEAFGRLSEEDKAKIIERSVSEVTGDYDAENEMEKVFTLTSTQASILVQLNAQVSDYARVRGTFMSVYPDFYGNGRWWLSDTGNKSYRACYVSDHGTISKEGESVGSTFMGIRPTIKLNVEDEFEFLTEEEEK